MRGLAPSKSTSVRKYLSRARACGKPTCEASRGRYRVNVRARACEKPTCEASRGRYRVNVRARACEKPTCEASRGRYRVNVRARACGKPTCDASRGRYRVNVRVRGVSRERVKNGTLSRQHTEAVGGVLQLTLSSSCCGSAGGSQCPRRPSHLARHR
jgi:hypothetical protein